MKFGRSVEYRAAPTSPSKADAQDSRLKGVNGLVDLAAKSAQTIHYPKELNAGT